MSRWWSWFDETKLNDPGDLPSLQSRSAKAPTVGEKTAAWPKLPGKKSGGINKVNAAKVKASVKEDY